MKVTARTIRHRKKQRQSIKIIKKVMALVAAALVFQYGTTNENDFFVDYDQYNQHLESKDWYLESATFGGDQRSQLESQPQSVTSIQLKTGSGTILRLRKPQNQHSDNKKYLTDELAYINKIEEVSRKFQNEEQDSEIQELKPKTKTPSGKNSIYVEALQSISSSRKINSSRGFSSNLKDPLTGNLIRPSTMLEAHITCGNEISKLPRVIEKQDKKINFGSDFFDMFRKQYEKVFGYNLLIEENVPKDANRNRIKRAEKRLFKTYGSKAQSDLRVRLFENPFVIKARECRYRDKPGYVTICNYLL